MEVTKGTFINDVTQREASFCDTNTHDLSIGSVIKGGSEKSFKFA